MLLPDHVTAFSTEQLRLLDTTLDPQLVAWAGDLNMNRPPVIKELALIAGWAAITKSQSFESDFRAAAEAGHDLSVQRQNLGYKSPVEMAGLAAGLAVKSSLYVAWYDLDAEAFATAPVDMFRALSDPRSEGLDRAVGSAPLHSGLVDYTGHSVFIENMFAAQSVVLAEGPEGLNRFLQARPNA